MPLPSHPRDRAGASARSRASSVRRLQTAETARRTANYDHLSRVASFVRDVAVADRERRLVVDQPKPDPKAPCRQ